jgi:hypothetical protein
MTCASANGGTTSVPERLGNDNRGSLSAKREKRRPKLSSASNEKRPEKSLYGERERAPPLSLGNVNFLFLVDAAHEED